MTQNYSILFNFPYPGRGEVRRPPRRRRARDRHVRRVLGDGRARPCDVQVRVVVRGHPLPGLLLQRVAAVRVPGGAPRQPHLGTGEKRELKAFLKKRCRLETLKNS